jgi:hypothetical protein
MDGLRYSSTRRQFLRAAGFGAATVAVGGGVLAATRGAGVAIAQSSARDHIALSGGKIFLAATDGYITMPERENDPVYIFGFIPVPDDTPYALEASYKGRSQHIAPILDTTEGADVYLTLTNLGLVQRPDLTDSHTLHWHGFRTPTSLFDGVPEVSIAVPISRQFTYFYRPHNAGTYMYHCHFEDVEHVQMGMTSIVFVRPAGHPNWAYNDSSTAFDRHSAILLNEIWDRYHDNDRDIQETIPTDYDPQWFTLNGRCYPQTVLPNDDPSLPDELRLLTLDANNGDSLPSQPVSALIQASPGEARDVLFTAPPYSAAAPTFLDAWGTYNRYFFRNRDQRKLANYGRPGTGGPNGGVAGVGGMATEVRVYAAADAVPVPDPASPIPPNLTYVRG